VHVSHSIKLGRPDKKINRQQQEYPSGARISVRSKARPVGVKGARGAPSRSLQVETKGRKEGANEKVEKERRGPERNARHCTSRASKAGLNTCLISQGHCLIPAFSGGCHHH